MKIKNLLLTIFISILAFQLNAQMPKVHSIGAMKDMGSTYDLHILLDTISPKSHLYGMGPYDRMKGEITVVDGKPYFATAFEEGNSLVKKTEQSEALVIKFKSLGTRGRLPPYNKNSSFEIK